MQNKRLIIIVLTSAILLLIPLIAMQFTDEVNWTLFDFVVAGALLLGTGLMCELVIRKINNIKYRIAVCVALLVVLLLIWAELAVGIFGTPLRDSKLKKQTLPATRAITHVGTHFIARTVNQQPFQHPQLSPQHLQFQQKNERVNLLIQIFLFLLSARKHESSKQDGKLNFLHHQGFLQV